MSVCASVSVHVSVRSWVRRYVLAYCCIVSMYRLYVYLYVCVHAFVRLRGCSARSSWPINGLRCAGVSAC